MFSAFIDERSHTTNQLYISLVDYNDLSSVHDVLVMRLEIQLFPPQPTSLTKDNIIISLSTFRIKGLPGSDNIWLAYIEIYNFHTLKGYRPAFEFHTDYIHLATAPY